jgi:hypothetical protein
LLPSFFKHESSELTIHSILTGSRTAVKTITIFLYSLLYYYLFRLMYHQPYPGAVLIRDQLDCVFYFIIQLLNADSFQSLCSYATVPGSDRLSLPSNILKIIVSCNPDNERITYQQAETTLLLQETIYGNSLVLKLPVLLYGFPIVFSAAVPTDNILVN